MAIVSVDVSLHVCRSAMQPMSTFYVPLNDSDINGQIGDSPEYVLLAPFSACCIVLLFCFVRHLC